jgi:hypothetical protein
MEDYEDDEPEDATPLEGMWWEDEQTFRTQELAQMPRMVEFSSGKIICGLMVNETSQYIELKWPCAVLYFPVQMKGQIVTGINMIKYAPGTHEEFITINKDQLVWWNETEAETDQFYFQRIQDIYQSAALYFSNMHQDVDYPSEDDPEIEAQVTQLTIGMRSDSVSDLLDKIFNKQQEPELVTKRSGVTDPDEGSDGLEPT